jgi:ribosome-associated toxin RatA of RatAB toxin-antitoxin module
MQGAHVVSWGSVRVSASAELAFAVLTDYDRMADFLPGMLASNVVSRKGSTVIVEQSADESLFLFRQRIDARLVIVEYPPHRLSISSRAGSFREFDGNYLLTRKNDHTLIEYRARFLPDFDLPPMIGPYAVQRSLERHLGALAEEIQRRLALAGAASAVGGGAKAGASGPAGAQHAPKAEPAGRARQDRQPGTRGEESVTPGTPVVPSGE